MSTPTISESDQLRATMVTHLREQGYIRSEALAQAMAVVPRHLFAPEATLADAYSARDVVVTKRNAAGRATSSVSASWLQAEMIESVQPAPGERVLEIGSGGYNAALLAELVGATGSVVSVDIDPWVTERATRFLSELGYGDRVTVVGGDAEHHGDEHGLFDVVVVTVGAWDAPWARLLAPGGRMVVPLSFATITRSITFVRDGDHLIGLNPTVCGFVAMQGAGMSPEQEVALADGAVRLTVEAAPPLELAALEQALLGEPALAWSGVTAAGNERYDTLQLWLATVEDRFATIVADTDRGAQVVDLASRWYCPALLTPHSFAYLTLRQTHPVGVDQATRYEFGAAGHGRLGADLAQQLADHIRVWDRAWRHGPGPSFTLHPAHTQVDAPSAGRIFPKRHTQLRLTWPDGVHVAAASQLMT